MAIIRNVTRGWAALRCLGPRPMLLMAWHRGPLARAGAARALRDRPAPAGRFLPDMTAPAPPPQGAAGLSPAHAAAVLARAAALPPAVCHGPFPAGAPAWGMDLFAPGDVRPVWEASRWAVLPLLAQAARLDPAAGHLARAEAWLAAWHAGNPAFRGPNWTNGQEAGLRALHLALALGLLGGAVPPGARAALALLARRIGAEPAHAAAQDNNHSVTEPAALLACGLLLEEPPLVRRGARRLEAAVLRLIAPDGGFAQLSTGYHRLLLDVLVVAGWLAARHGGPRLGAAAWTRAAAATAWLRRMLVPETGATPRLGHQDGSAFADLSLAGPDDARPSLERAARWFLGASAGWPEDAGCRWLGLPAGPALPAPPAAWAAGGVRGWQAGGARGFLRTGPLRFRPGQADLLHFDLWDGPLNLLRDGGTGAYNPAPGCAWWWPALAGVGGHNTIQFDGAEPMPRLTRFLLGGWPAGGPLPTGGWVRDRRGFRHARAVQVAGRVWRVTDRLAGGFAEAVLRWRLAPATWAPCPGGVAGPLGSVTVAGDGPLTIRLERGWESPAYGAVRPVPVLVARLAAPGRGLTTLIRLPG